VKNLIGLLVAMCLLSTGCNSNSSPASKPTATLEQKERCSRDAQAFTRTEGYVVLTTSHIDAGTGLCLVMVNDDRSPSYVGHIAFDANERRQLAEFGESVKGADTSVYTCWVADNTGFHRACPSLEKYNYLLNKYYGVIQ
jgi:hypothetical protein